MLSVTVKITISVMNAQATGHPSVLWLHAILQNQIQAATAFITNCKTIKHLEG